MVFSDTSKVRATHMLRQFHRDLGCANMSRTSLVGLWVLSFSCNRSTMVESVILTDASKALKGGGAFNCRAMVLHSDV